MPVLSRNGLVCLAVLASAAVHAETAWLATHSLSGQVPVKSWKALRDAEVVKQNLDYSCGAASLATLLNGFYGQGVTEEALLKAMDKGDGRPHLKICSKPCPSSASWPRDLLPLTNNWRGYVCR